MFTTMRRSVPRVQGEPGDSVSETGLPHCEYVCLWAVLGKDKLQYRYAALLVDVFRVFLHLVDTMAI